MAGGGGIEGAEKKHMAVALSSKVVANAREDTPVDACDPILVLARAPLADTTWRRA
jgi:hypothetical protein